MYCVYTPIPAKFQGFARMLCVHVCVCVCVCVCACVCEITHTHTRRNTHMYACSPHGIRLKPREYHLERRAGVHRPFLFCWQVYTNLFFKASVDDAGAKAKVYVCVCLCACVCVRVGECSQTKVLVCVCVCMCM